MGKSNVSRVYADWTHLEHQPFRLLAYLALRSIDTEAPAVYYGGWEDLARASRIPWDPEDPDLSDLDTEAREAAEKQRTRARRRALNRVGRLLRALEEAGAIIRAGGVKTGRRQVIGLTLEPTRTYTARGWTHRERVRHTAAGTEEAYSVPVPNWQPVQREDPRPCSAPQVLPDVVPAVLPDVVPAVLPDVVPEVLPDVRTRYYVRGYPKRTQEEVEDSPQETGGGEIVITSQPNPSTRASSNGPMNEEDQPRTFEDHRNEDGARLLAWAAANWTPDQHEDATA